MKNESQNTAVSFDAATARAVKYALKRPILLIAAVSLIVGLGLYINWPAIIALGLAPLVLMLAPCTLMCAIGLCARPRGKTTTDGELPSRDGQP